MAYGDYGEVIQLRGARCGVRGLRGLHGLLPRVGDRYTPGQIPEVDFGDATDLVITSVTPDYVAWRFYGSATLREGGAPIADLPTFQNVSFFDRVLHTVSTPPGSYVAAGVGALALIGPGWYFLKRR